MPKIILTEKQFKDYMRIVLQEKRSKEHALSVINEILENGYEDEELPDGYSILCDGYMIDTGNIEDIDGMMILNDSDDVETPEEAMEVIKYSCTYPEESEEYDWRYANNIIPIFTICKHYIYSYNEFKEIDRVKYMSNIDKEYYPIISQILLKNGYELKMV